MSMPFVMKLRWRTVRRVGVVAALLCAGLPQGTLALCKADLNPTEGAVESCEATILQIVIDEKACRSAIKAAREASTLRVASAQDAMHVARKQSQELEVALSRARAHVGQLQAQADALHDEVRAHVAWRVANHLTPPASNNNNLSFRQAPGTMTEMGILDRWLTCQKRKETATLANDACQAAAVAEKSRLDARELQYTRQADDNNRRVFRLGQGATAIVDAEQAALEDIEGQKGYLTRLRASPTLASSR